MSGEKGYEPKFAERNSEKRISIKTFKSGATTNREGKQDFWKYIGVQD